MQELPPKHYADKVIDWFFAKLNYTRYPIDERLFRICASCVLRDPGAVFLIRFS